MSSSSMRKLGQRSTHKERSQPLERQKLGLLEKHKDYSLRAKDFNKKKAYLKVLRQKAAERNEDEFYHKMLSRRGPGSAATRAKGSFDGTVAGDRGNRALSMDVVRLLKTQDQGYLRTMRNIAAKEVRELEQQVAVSASFAGLAHHDVEDIAAAAARGDDSDDEDRRGRRRRKPTKVVFAADPEERDAAMADADGGGDSPRAKAESDDGFNGFDDDVDGKGKDDDDKADKVAMLSRKLGYARRRLRALTQAENELEMQRARMAKTATVAHFTKSGKKIKARERKR